MQTDRFTEDLEPVFVLDHVLEPHENRRRNIAAAQNYHGMLACIATSLFQECSYCHRGRALDQPMPGLKDQAHRLQDLAFGNKHNMDRLRFCKVRA